MNNRTSLLVAMPVLKESIFTKTVILMGEWESTGALGFIINSITGTNLSHLLRAMKLEKSYREDLPILFGGPIQTDFLWSLHSPDYATSNTREINSLINMTPALEIIKISKEVYCPEIFHIGVGYSGWSPNQLEKEIEDGAWWNTEFNPKIVLETGYKNMWDQIIAEMGMDLNHYIDSSTPDNTRIN